MATRRLLTLMMVLMLALGGGGIALAQDDGPSPDSPTKDRNDDSADEEADDPNQDDGEATPVVDDGPLPEAPDGPLDLAAMTLDSAELPEDYQLLSEAYIDLGLLEANYVDVLEPGELEDLGIVGYYETTYTSVDGDNRIRSYVIEYTDIAAAEDGFDVLEDEDRLVKGDADLEDAPGLAGVGEEPAEITTGTFGSAGAEQATVDITFRIDRLGVGVAMETFDGSEPDQDLVEELAAAKEARVVAALTGEEIANVDPDLVERVVTFDGATTFEGYQTVVDGYGDPASPAAEGFVASYVRGATFSEDTLETIAPYVTVSVSSYEDEDAVLTLFESTGQLIQQYPELESIDVPLINGSPTVGFSFDSLIPGDEVASVRIFVAVDDVLVTVDVQGVATTDQALDAAIAVAETATACVDGGACGPVALPAVAGGDDGGTPVSAPEDEEDQEL